MGVYPKNVKASPEAMANYAMVSMMLGSLQQVQPEDDAAILYYPGVYDTQMQDYLEEWAAHVLPLRYKHVLVAGHHAEAGQHAFLTHEVVKGVFGSWRSVHCQVHAAHTGEQASWVAEKAIECSLGVFYLFVPAFHLPRAYLTTLKALIKAEIAQDVLLLPRALPMNPVLPLPMVPPFEEDVYIQSELVGGEAKKMLAYTADVATLAELEQYLAIHL